VVFTRESKVPAYKAHLLLRLVTKAIYVLAVRNVGKFTRLGQVLVGHILEYRRLEINRKLLNREAGTYLNPA
ncbi:MAG: hypothetical protein P8Y60_18645, partial [Calditrichota bacterium]